MVVHGSLPFTRFLRSEIAMGWPGGSDTLRGVRTPSVLRTTTGANMQIRVVPNTGVQYIQLNPLSQEELDGFSEMVELRPSQIDGRLPLPAPVVADEDDWSDDYEDGDSQRRTASAVGIAPILDAVSRCWFPVPFDRGGVWAAVHLSRRAEGGFNAVLAVDTTLSEDGNPDHGLEAAELGECRVRAAFKRFWRHPYVGTWLDRIVDHPRIASLISQGRMQRIDREDLLLGVYSLARILGESGVRVEFAPRPESGDAINVDLILDLGNSRTCVLLAETGQGKRFERLELVYPDEPSRAHPCPFETQLVFAEHQIGPVSSAEGSPFPFLSQVKLGPPATRVLQSTTLDTRPLGLSSPKRYLWDDRECVPWDWRLAEADRDGDDPPMIRGDILKHMDTTNPLRPPAIPELPLRRNHPRLVVELLEQAFRQINTPGWRRAADQAPLHERRREIGNVVIMHPAGMHSIEIDTYRKACLHACRLWSAFRSSPQGFRQSGPTEIDPLHGVRRPQVQVVADEATSVQLCWLYGELMDRHAGDIEGFFKHLGRLRPRIEAGSTPSNEPQSVLRVASLDIGGGTIDLSIADYGRDETLRTSIAVVSRRLFHDGISRAGDDIIRGLLQQVVFPDIQAQAGIGRFEWDRVLFESGEENPRRLRGQLVRNVWLPIAYRILELHEEMSGSESEGRGESLPGRRSGTEVSVRELLGGLGDSQLAELARQLGLPGPGVIKDVKIRFDSDRMRRVVRRAVGTTIMHCADIVHQYGCDLLVVGGRPSSMEAVRELIRNSMAVPPGQIVFLSDSRVGDWYPFRGRGGRIEDAKTCGVVGGSVVFRGRYGLDGFLLRTVATVEPPAMFGFLQREIAVDRVEFDDAALLSFGDKEPVELTLVPQAGDQAGLVLAMRRINDRNAEAKPLYQVQLKARYRRMLERSPVHQKPVTVRLKLRSARVQEQLEVGRSIEIPGGMIDDVIEAVSFHGVVEVGGGRPAVDASQAMQLVFRTAFEDDGYWIDTGRLRTSLEGGRG